MNIKTQKLKTFEISEWHIYPEDSDKFHIGTIKAKNLQNAEKRVLREYLTKEQRKNLTVEISDSDVVSYRYNTEYFNAENGELLENVEEYDEDTMTYKDYEIMIEEKESH